MGPAGPENGPKTPRKAKKRVLVKTLATGGVTGRSTPPFTCTMGVFDRFRRVRDPNGTILTTFGLPTGPAGARKFFRSGVPGVPKNFSSNIIFVQKRYSLGPEWVWGPKKLILDPLRPPKRRHFGPFYIQNGRNGIQKQPKNALTN